MRTPGSVRRTTIGLGVALALGLAACSGSDEAGVETTADGGEEYTEDAGDAEESAGDTGGGTGDEGADGETAPRAPDVAVGGTTAGRDVIREASLTVASNDPEATVDAIGRAAEAAGGFVAGTDLSREDGVLRGTVTVRVPSDTLSGTLTRIEAAGAELRSRQLSSRDVTGEVADVEAQLRNLRAVEAQLLDLLAEARADGGTDDVLVVFDRMRGIRDEIERLQGRQATLADLVALATVTTRVVPTDALLASTEPLHAPEPAPWDVGAELSRAWDATVRGLQAVVAVVIVVLVTVLPLVLVWAVPIGLVVLAVRRVRRDRAGTEPASRGRRTPVGSLRSGPESDED